MPYPFTRNSYHSPENFTVIPITKTDFFATFFAEWQEAKNL